MTGQLEAGARAERALHVLVVDDNKDAADSLSLLLRMWGYDCRVAYDGPSAWEAACTHHPDCMLLDIGLPHMDGYDVAERVRRQPGMERVKLVAVTAYADEAHRRRIQETGFDYHMVKPADPAELRGLMEMLNEVLRLAGRTEELARQSVALAGQTNELLEGVKEDVREVREDLKELKQITEHVQEVTEEVRDLRGVKEALKEVKEDVRGLKEEVREIKEAQGNGGSLAS
jgi:CheY-like chemotaxis protein